MYRGYPKRDGRRPGSRGEGLEGIAAELAHPSILQGHSRPSLALRTSRICLAN